jgi:N-acetylmuramoyl-L-alanine amidase
MARWPAARWEPGAPCSGTLRPVAVTLHHQAGSGNPLPVYKSRNVSAHFWIPRTGQPVQHVDTSVRAWHGVAHNDYGIGVETEGCGAPPHADPLTEHQLNMFADLMRWANQAHGIPLRLSESVTEPGLNYHRCKGGPATGCPCDVRVNARVEILRRAGGGASTPAPPQEEDLPLNNDDKAWISKAINDALRQQFAPSGECYTRVRGADNDAIQQNSGNFTKWAEEGARKAK